MPFVSDRMPHEGLRVIIHVALFRDTRQPCPDTRTSTRFDSGLPARHGDEWRIKIECGVVSRYHPRHSLR
jgi:hypothetical protein